MGEWVSSDPGVMLVTVVILSAWIQPVTVSINTDLKLAQEGI